MRPPRRASWALLGVLAAAAGCALLEDEPDPSTLVCRTDAECGANEVCFPDGCGDPGRDIVVEVTPNPEEGLHAQDFPVPDLRPEQDLTLFGPARVLGRVVRATSLPEADGGVATRPYSEPLHLRATGQSALLPGVARQYDATLVPINGTWALPVGTGDYTVTLTAADAEVPPVRGLSHLEPGAEVPLELVLPAPDAVAPLRGRVVRQGDVLVDSPLEVQALDADLTPLSQRVPVVRGSGDFTLVIPAEAAQRSAILVRVTSAGSTPWVPQKTFTVDPRAPLTEPLELGDTGDPVRLTGRVVGPDGRPVPGATVALRGEVAGGGTFHGPLATTGTDGRFGVDTLPAVPGGTLQLVVVPPSGLAAGLTVLPVEVPATGATLPDIVCATRRVVSGDILLPDSTEAAAGVRVVAEPIDEVPGWPRPPGGGEALGTTNDQGTFVLSLDPAVYRVDFLPPDTRPRVSRVITVLPGDDTEPQELATFSLQKGRTVTGRVTDGARALPYASIRFYRVVTLEGRPTTVLLAQTVSDHQGRYTALIPVR
ncbi:carboxypeptidase-like regulatory domain-containing protein [Pyxidicoccus xibeiensis]|uniref:carboxypeptidase-like regulatory domain-containing protein n=1 Tax=Pyxidicoccus xibeiensis TaxID=2906759 RepID=UPI0020A76D7B|nr:carboxypeptidase-like regulatory domain-containing protein [Pyxidicoccus xibeiensis]MCP3138010.1 carboxypeptidase-like regulatory domain-containing protein [Pyxidicoccus xibeiensis]